MKTIWIIDYDDTLIPTTLIIKYINNINTKIDFFTINNILINLIDIYAFLYKIREDTIYILTASLNPWVENSLEKINELLIINKDLIDLNYVKKNTNNYNDLFVKLLLNKKINLIFNLLNDFVKIYYVNDIEKNIYDNSERFYKYNSMKFILDLNKDINNVISIGDNDNNEGEVTKLLSEIYYKKIFKFIHFENKNFTYDYKIYELQNLINYIDQIKNDKSNSKYVLNKI